MNISFILSTNNRKEDAELLKQWLDNVFKFKRDDFEVIVIDNYFQDDKLLTIIADNMTKYPKQIQILTNYKTKDIASSRNLAIKMAQGNYLAFLHVSELLDEKYFKSIDKAIKDGIDLIEYKSSYKWEGQEELTSVVLLETTKVYHLKEETDKVVFAFSSPLLSTKLFKKSIIISSKIKFRKPLQFDSFFIYVSLTHAKTFCAIDQTLIHNYINIITYDNTIELINQWIHILNYYNNKQLKKKLNRELEYAFVRYSLFSILKVISVTNNKHLMQKVYNHIKDYIFYRYKDFRNNPYLNEDRVKGDLFPETALNLNQYLKEYFIKNNLKDDSKLWE